MSRAKHYLGRLRGFILREVHQSYLVVGICAGVIVGVIMGLILRINYFASPVWLVGAGVACVVAFWRPRVGLVAAMVGVGMVLAFFRVAGELTNEINVRALYGQEMTVMGEIMADPVTDESGTKFKLGNLQLGEQVTGGNIYVGLAKNENLKWGDTIELKGKLDSGFGTYLGQMYRPRLERWRRPEPGNIIIRVRDWFAERVRGLVPDLEARLGLSYLMGMKSGLPDGFSEKLRVVGLTHIVVASGTHLSILVEVARKIFGRVSRFAGVLFAGLFVVIFMALVGWTPSILRAGVMALLTLVCWYFGRKMAPWRMMLLVMAGALLAEPMFVIDLGFLLSFASYAGIMMLGPGVTKFFYGRKKPGWVASAVITTLSATVMTLPIILYYYGQVSLIAVLANLAILPTLPYVMGAVFIAGCVAGIPGIEMTVGWVVTRALDFHIVVVEWLGELRQLLIEIPPGQGWVFALYGVVVAPVVMWYLYKRIAVRQKVCYNNRQVLN